jgi:hypothetical protein
MGVLNRYSECGYTLVDEESNDITGTVSTAIPSHANSAAFFIKNGSTGTAIVKLQGSCDGTNFYDMINTNHTSQNSITTLDTLVVPIAGASYFTGNPPCLPLFVKIVVTSGNLGTSAVGNIFFAYSSI